MSTHSQDQEIDLGQVFNKVSGFFKSIVNHFFDLIFFIQKKIIIIGVLFIIGVALAYLVDGKKKYEHELAVIPNFGSNEYLYKKTEAFDNKLREEDSFFFKEIGISNFKDILSVKIKAFPGIYKFVNKKNQENSFELIKLMAKDGSLTKIIEDDITSINYYRHKILIVTKGMWKKEKLTTPFLNYLNNSSYFLEQQKVQSQNLLNKLIANDSLIKQIDKIIASLSSNNRRGASISISEKNSISELINKKDNLISESQELKATKIIFDKIIKEESSVLNTRHYVSLVFNKKVYFPVLLILLYFFGFSFIRAYKKQKLR